MDDKQQRSNIRLAIMLGLLAAGIFGMFVWANFGGGA